MEIQIKCEMTEDESQVYNSPELGDFVAVPVDVWTDIIDTNKDVKETMLRRNGIINTKMMESSDLIGCDNCSRLISVAEYRTSKGLCSVCVGAIQ